MSDLNALAEAVQRAPKRRPPKRRPFWTARKVRACKWVAVVVVVTANLLVVAAWFHMDKVRSVLGITPILVVTSAK